jgi:hypothetical protein
MDLDTALAFVKQYHEEIMVLATVVVALGTWGLVIGANLTAQRELRAYMGFKNGSIRHVSVGQKPALDIFFGNFGKTPAYGVRTGLKRR